MATQELKSVTIRVPSDLLELIEAKISDRDTRTDVIINLLNQALKQPVANSDLGISVLEQKVFEVNQRVDDLVKSLSSVRHQVTSLDNKPNSDLAEWIKQVEAFESRLSIVEKNKSPTESPAQKQLEQLELIKPNIIEVDSIEEAITEPIEKTIQVANTVSLEPLTQAELADRFGDKKYRSQISANKLNLANWSKSKDPDSIAWEYQAETKKYYPLSQ